jgi:hypothetical protein
VIHEPQLPPPSDSVNEVNRAAMYIDVHFTHGANWNCLIRSASVSVANNLG